MTTCTGDMADAIQAPIKVRTESGGVSVHYLKVRMFDRFPIDSSTIFKLGKEVRIINAEAVILSHVQATTAAPKSKRPTRAQADIRPAVRSWETTVKSMTRARLVQSAGSPAWTTAAKAEDKLAKKAVGKLFEVSASTVRRCEDAAEDLET